MRKEIENILFANRLCCFITLSLNLYHCQVDGMFYLWCKNCWPYLSKRIFTTRGAIDTMRYTDCNAKDVGISIFLENTLFGILFGLIIYVFKESFDTAKMV